MTPIQQENARSIVPVHTVATSLARPRPPHPDFAETWPASPKGVIRSAWRGVREALFKGIDAGWYGFRPLRTHAVICGFERSGSTLLQLMIETCVSDAR